MQTRPNSHRMFQVTAAVTSLFAVVLMVGFKGLAIHKELFGAIEALLLTSGAANLFA